MKRFLLSAMLLLTASFAWSQGPLELMVTGSSYHVKTEVYDEYYYGMYGGNVGIGVNYHWNSHFSLNGGLAYSERVAGYVSYGWCGTPPTPYFPLLSQNIEIQTNLRFYPLGQRKITPYALFGISQFVRIGSKLGMGLEAEEWVHEFPQDYQSYDIGLNLNLGLRANLLKRFFVEIGPGLRMLPFHRDNVFEAVSVNTALGFRL